MRINDIENVSSTFFCEFFRMFLVLHGDFLVRSIVNRFSSKRTDISMIYSDNINIRAVTIHIIGDLLQGIGDLFAGILICFKVKRRSIEISIEFDRFSPNTNSLIQFVRFFSLSSLLQRHFHFYVISFSF